MNHANDNFKSERIFIENVAAIIGVPLRTAQLMASRGELPSAVKIGRRWSFNELAIRGWLTQREIECQSARLQRTPIGAAPCSGRRSALKARPIGSHYGQTIQQLRAAVSKNSAAS
jgi:predicted DNA-binding transcriptional regulator AlpA